MSSVALLSLLLALACNFGQAAPAVTSTATQSPLSTLRSPPPPTPASGESRPIRFGLTTIGPRFDCATVRATGAQAIWATMFWQYVEPEQDQWTFDKIDGILAEVEACGIEVDLKFRTGQEHWGVLPVEDPENAEPNEEGKRGSRPPRSLDDYYDWVFHTAEHYRGRVRAYAIENEVNTPTFWLGTYAEYQAMLETAYAAIHAADPEAQVTESGMASVTYSLAVARWRYEQGDLAGAMDWLNRYLARRDDGKYIYADAERYLAAQADPAVNEEDEEALREILYSDKSNRVYDTMTRHFQHPDAFDIYQLHFYEPWDLLPELLEWIRGRMSEHGPVKPIEAWEIGYAEADDSQYDPDLHGRDTAKVMLAALGEGVERVYYLPYSSYRAGLGMDEIWWGLVDPDGNPRPALESYLQTATRLDGFTTAARLSAGPDEWAYQFDDTVARWTREGEVVLETGQ